MSSLQVYYLFYHFPSNFQWACSPAHSHLAYSPRVCLLARSRLAYSPRVCLLARSRLAYSPRVCLSAHSHPAYSPRVCLSAHSHLAYSPQVCLSAHSHPAYSPRVCLLARSRPVCSLYFLRLLCSLALLPLAYRSDFGFLQSALFFPHQDIHCTQAGHIPHPAAFHMLLKPLFLRHRYR